MANLGEIDDEKLYNFGTEMRSINLKVIQEGEKLYSLHLGNVKWLNFKSKSAAEKFCRDYKRILGDNIKILSSLQGQIYNLYRSYYFQLDQDTSRRVMHELHAFDELFNRIFASYSEGNQNGFVFMNISNCFGRSLQTVSLLKEFSKRYKIYSLKHQVLPLKKMIMSLENEYEKDKNSLELQKEYQHSRKVISISSNIKTTGTHD